MFPWMMMVALMSSAASVAAAPELPPLPPLPGMAAPAPAPAEEVAETKEPEVAETPQEAVAEVPQMEPLPSAEDVADEDMFAVPEIPMSGDGELAMPDFGLFDPSALPPPPGEAEVVEMPELPEVPKAPTEDAELADVLEAPGLPAFPPLPGFDQDLEVELEAQATDKKPTEGEVADSKEESEIPDLADLAPPSLPDEAPIDSDLADALPSWATDETLPALKPLPQDRDTAKPTPPKKKPTQKAEFEPENKGDEPSIADIIDKEINSGDSYNEDEPSSIAEMEADADSKRVVWPRNFKTQRLPPEIYRKQYSNANRHLPHAIYQKEIEAHLFGAVGANDADAVRALLRTGVPVNIKNAHGEDLVMHAVKSYATTTLQLILALGADPSQQDRYGATPLHRAVFQGRQDMATILLRAGANSYVNDMSGVTPMAIAVARRDQAMMQTLGYYQASGYSNQQRMANYQPY